MADTNRSLRVSDAARAELARQGFDPAYGARPLKRVVQQRLENLIASLMHAGQLPDGGTVVVDWDRGEFTFESTEHG